MKKTHHCSVVSMAVKGFLLLTAAFVLLPSSVQAQCKQWYVGGTWTAHVFNGPSVSVKITQSDNSLSGEAEFINQVGPSYKGTKITYGVVNGDDFEIGIAFNLEAAIATIFKGKIGPDGKIKGKASFLTSRYKGEDWISSVPMKCHDDRYEPINRLKIKPATPAAPVYPGPVTFKVPGIVASPNNLLIRAPKTEGKTTLTWDAGKDHRYAEVWVKVDSQDETKVVESGKGALQVTIVPGKTYIYMLEDKGKVLASVTVKFHL